MKFITVKKITSFILGTCVFFFGVTCSIALESSAELPVEPHKVKTVRGQLRPEQYAVLASGISARLNRFSVKPGDFLEKGQEIAVFECGYERAEEAVAQARLNAAQAKLEVNKRLEKLNNVSGLEVRLSQAEVVINEGEVKKVQEILRECSLFAPFSGIVVGKFIQSHQYVNKGDPLLELVNNQSLEVQMVIPSRWLREIKKETRFSIHLDEINTILQGNISRIVGNIDPVSQTIHVMGTLEKTPIPLLLGMSGIVSFDELSLLQQ